MSTKSNCKNMRIRKFKFQASTIKTFKQNLIQNLAYLTLTHKIDPKGGGGA